jgi:hypothetical protein
MRPTFALLALALLPAATLAQAASDPTASDDRFQIERKGETFIRLDRKTGAISTCTLEGAALDCRASADERAALQAEIDRLATENEALKSATTAGTAETGITKDGKQLTLKLPSEAEIKEVASFFEDMLRRFVAAVKDLANGEA